MSKILLGLSEGIDDTTTDGRGSAKTRVSANSNERVRSGLKRHRAADGGQQELAMASKHSQEGMDDGATRGYQPAQCLN